MPSGPYSRSGPNAQGPRVHTLSRQTVQEGLSSKALLDSGTHRLGVASGQRVVPLQPRPGADDALGGVRGVHGLRLTQRCLRHGAQCASVCTRGGRGRSPRRRGPQRPCARSRHTAARRQAPRCVRRHPGRPARRVSSRVSRLHTHTAVSVACSFTRQYDLCTSEERMVSLHTARGGDRRRLTWTTSRARRRRALRATLGGHIHSYTPRPASRPATRTTLDIGHCMEWPKSGPTPAPRL